MNKWRNTNQILKQMDGFLEASWACLAGSGALRRAQAALRGWSLNCRLACWLLFSFFNAFFCVLGAILEWFWTGLGLENLIFCIVFSKTSILRKSCSRRGEIAIFKVSRLMKTMQNPCKIVFEKSLQKSDPKKWFLFDLGVVLDGPGRPEIQNTGPGALQKFTKIHPRCSKNWFWDVFWTRLFSKAGFRRVLDGFWWEFGWILRVADRIVDSYFDFWHALSNTFR